MASPRAFAQSLELISLVRTNRARAQAISTGVAQQKTA